MTIGGRLKMLRLKRRLTLQEVAIKIGLAKSSYAGYESGYRNPPIDKLIAIANLYNVSTDYILRLTDTPDTVEFLQKKYLQWDGINLNEKELEIVHQVVDLITERHEEQAIKFKHMNSS